MNPTSTTPITHSARTLNVLLRRTQRWPWSFPLPLEVAYTADRRQQGRSFRVVLLCMPLLAVWATLDFSLLKSSLPDGAPGWMAWLAMLSLAVPLLAAAMVASARRLGERLVRWVQIVAITLVSVWLLGWRQWSLGLGEIDDGLPVWLAAAWIMVSAFGRYRWSYLLPGIVGSAAVLMLQDAFMSHDAAALLGREAMLTLLFFIVAGVLCVHQDRSQRLMWLLEQNQRVQSRLDGLTGLPHRREWNLRLARGWSELRRGGNGSVTLALIDIAAFADFNLRHGHTTGDRALSILADRLKAWEGQSDSPGYIARYADDQFTVLWTGLDASSAQQRTAALAQELQCLTLTDALQHPVKFSARVASAHLESISGHSPDDLEAAAGRRLAALKRPLDQTAVITDWPTRVQPA